MARIVECISTTSPPVRRLRNLVVKVRALMKPGDTLSATDPRAALSPSVADGGHAREFFSMVPLLVYAIVHVWITDSHQARPRRWKGPVTPRMSARAARERGTVPYHSRYARH